MSLFRERRARKNITIDAALLSTLQAEADRTKQTVSDVIEGRVLASYAAESGEEARIWEALHQLQRDVDAMVSVLTPLATWLASMGLMGEAVEVEAEAPVEPTDAVEVHSADEFYQQAMVPPQPTAVRPVVQKKRRWWEGSA